MVLYWTGQYIVTVTFLIAKFHVWIFCSFT